VKRAREHDSGSAAPAQRRGEVVIRVKRVYERAAGSDGVRVLVDRLWPRGLSKAAARVDVWARELAPSDALRRWFGHDPAKWPEFRRRYFEELRTKELEVKEIERLARGGRLTLLYGARHERHNNAVALAAFLRKRLPRGLAGRRA